MQRIRTPLTAMLECRVPLFGASMAGYAGGALAASVSKAGGVGFIGIDAPSHEYIDTQLAIARDILGRTDSARIPIGIGFIGWLLDAAENGDVFVRKVAPQVQVIWLSFGKDLRKWYDVARAADDTVKVAIIVNSVAEALAAASWGADIIVVQGIEAGGHGSANGIPIISLLPAVLSALDSETRGAGTKPVVLAAGGIVNGTQAAAVLTLGADGFVLGTRLLATPEILKCTDEQKNLIVQAGELSTVRTTIFDHIRGIMGWPQTIDGRGLRNKTYDDYAAGRPFDENKVDFDVALKNNDVSRITTWSGSSVGSVKAIMPAGDVVKELEEDIITSIDRLRNVV